MKFRHLASLLALAVTSPLAAQEATAPRIVEDGKTYDMQIRLNGFGMIEDRDNPPMRTPQERSDPADWFADRSNLVRAIRREPAKMRWGGIILAIDPAGKVVDCRFEEGGNLPGSEASVCQDFGGMQFMPALSQDGTPMAGRYQLYISRSRTEVKPGDKRKPLIDRTPAPQTMMQVPRPNLVPYEFPPAWWWLDDFYVEPVSWGQEPRRGGTDLPDFSDATGIILSHGDETPLCNFAKRTRVAANDIEACKFAVTVLAPVWGAQSARKGRAIPVVMVATGNGAFEAYGPLIGRRESAGFAAGSEDEFVTALTNAGVFPAGRAASELRLSVEVNAQGEPRLCRILDSSGSDAGDIDACRLARTVARIEPRQDLFGRPQDQSTLYWDAASGEE